MSDGPDRPSNPEITAWWDVAVELTSAAARPENSMCQTVVQPAAAALAASVAAYEPELVDKVLTNIS